MPNQNHGTPNQSHSMPNQSHGTPNQSHGTLNQSHGTPNRKRCPPCLLKIHVYHIVDLFGIQRNFLCFIGGNQIDIRQDAVGCI